MFSIKSCIKSFQQHCVIFHYALFNFNPLASLCQNENPAPWLSQTVHVQCTLYSVQLKTVKLDSTPSQLQVSYSNLTNLPFFKKLSCRNPKEEKMNTERDFLELNA